MAESIVDPSLIPDTWNRKFFYNWFRETRFKRYMSKSRNTPIYVNEDLANRDGTRIIFPLLRDNDADGVKGRERLKGKETPLDTRSMYLQAEYYRHAVSLDKKTKQESAVDLADAQEVYNKRWAERHLNKMLISSLSAVANTNGTFTSYADADQATRNAWLTNNTNNVIFGKNRSNTVAGDFAASFANIDGTDDLMTPQLLSKAKRMAQNRPIAIIEPTDTGENDEENYVALMHPTHFRDLANNAELKSHMAQALERGLTKNRLWTGGALYWDGIFIREIPEFPLVGNVGASGATVAASYLLGNCALGIGWIQRPTGVTDTDDYKFITGVGVEQFYGASKLMFGTGKGGNMDKPIDHGVVTMFAHAGADA